VPRLRFICAEHPQYPENVALKLIRFDDKSKDDGQVDAAPDEAAARRSAMFPSRLDHPNIIKSSM
jgi:hypothetical protein